MRQNCKLSANKEVVYKEVKHLKSFRKYIDKI